MQLRSLGALLVLAPLAAAQSFQFSLDGLSTTSIVADLSLPLPGNAIGDYDATTNPTGTRTCTTLFGTCNNTAIPLSATALTEFNIVGTPSGGFRGTLDTKAGVLLVSDLSVSVIGRQGASADLTLEVLYSTFRTQQPNSIFPGGVPLPLPLGQGSIDDVLLVQTGPAVPVVLTPSGVAGVFTVAGLVPAELSFQLDLLGQVSAVGPLPFALPLAGTLDLTGANPRFTLSVDQSAQQTVPNPAPGQVIEDLAFPLPTVLPPGGTANLLLDLTPGDLGISNTTDLDWLLFGAPICETASYCTATPNTFSSGAACAATGSTSLAFNTFTLSAQGVPPGHAGRFYMSRNQASLPFGDGTLCLGTPIRRLPVVYADASGLAQYAIDFNDPAQPTALIAPGDTWNFQLVFRDPIGGPLTFNTSNALSASFCP
jgi:hypothetical protein